MTLFSQVPTRSLSFCWSIRLFWFIPFLCGVVSQLSRYVHIGWPILRESTTVCTSKLHTTQVSHVWRNVQQLVQHNTGRNCQSILDSVSADRRNLTLLLCRLYCTPLDDSVWVFRNYRYFEPILYLLFPRRFAKNRDSTSKESNLSTDPVDR